MAIFTLSNAAGFGFNMSGTNSAGWSFVTADPSITETLVYDDGYTAIWEISGSAFVDQFGVTYWTDGYNVTIYDVGYANNGSFVLTVEDLNLWTTFADLQAGAWFVNLNAGFDTFYGNDYVDFIRGGDGWDEIYGYAGDDTLYGDAGSDWLDGGSGSDLMYGGTGDDIFVVNNAWDFVGEVYGEGRDEVLTYLNAYTLGTNVEDLTFIGAGSFRGNGNSLSNVIEGYTGYDVLSGGSGNDKLNGGSGKDTLYGGSGKDTFVFNTKLGASNVDRIADYKVSDDTIHLDNKYLTKLKAGKLSSSAFWKGSKAHDKDDRVIYDSSKGYLYYDADGTGSSKQVLIATVAKNLKMAASEFYVI